MGVSVTVEQIDGVWGAEQSHSTRTQADGTFLMEELPAGFAQLMARDKDHGHGELTGVEIEQGKGVEGVVITLRSGATLRGVVFGPEGQPVPQVMVLESTPYRPGSFNRDISMTDGDGQFVLNGLEPGRTTIVARHKGFQEASKVLEVQPGDNFLKLRLGGGQRVLGQVVGAEGLPLAAAMVMLNAQGDQYRNYQGSTDHVGRFELENIADGSYSLAASHADHASSTLSDEVVVAGAPVEGLLLRLEKGAVIVGRVQGLEFDELAQTQIFASSQLGIKLGAVDFEARYRVPGVGPGDWTVAVESSSGRRAQGQVTVEPGDLEVELDLEIKEGYTLSGTVLHGEEPLGGATVQLSGIDVQSYGGGKSDYRGAYRISGLDAGHYRLHAVGPQGGLSHQEELEIRGDLEHQIVLEGSRVTGRVLEGPGGVPLAGVRFSVDFLDNEEGLLGWRQERTQSNSQGNFDLGELTPGRWLVKAQKEGYSEATAEVEVVRGSDLPPLEMTLSPTEGLWLTVHTPGVGGQFRGIINLALLDTQGRPVATAFLQLDPEGEIHFATAPVGSWQLLVSGDGLAPERFAVQVPEDHPQVTLTPGGGLEIEIPELSTQPATAHAELRGTGGELFTILGQDGVLRSSFPFHQTRGAVGDLPPGTWSVEVTADDGRRWSGVGTVVAGERATLRLE